MMFNEALVHKLSQSEPGWLSQQRQQAWKSYSALPFPTPQDEEWKYTDLKDFKLETFETPPHETTRHPGGVHPGGVIVCDIHTALQKHASVIEPVLKEIQKVSTSKFEWMHQAFWNEGTFIYVPKGVLVETPIVNKLVISPSQGGVGVFPFTIVVVEPSAKAIVIDEVSSENAARENATRANAAQEQFSNAFYYLWVKEQATLQYVHIQRWSESVTHVESQVARVGKDAKLDSVHVGLGSKLTKARLHTILEGKGAQANPLGVFFGGHDQRFDVYTIQDHAEGETQSDLLFKSALKDRAQSCYQGIIRIPRQSQRSNAYQANRNLLLAPHAKARSSPKLEIIADDVRCTHGATVGNIDENETFYLESRGLSRQEAIRLIVQGFFEQVLERIPSGDIRARLHEVVLQKLEGSSDHV